MTFRRAVVWLRRDLRLDDNMALFEAARAASRICAVFVLDPDLLASPRMGAPIVQFFFSALGALRDDLRSRGSDLALLRGRPEVELAAFARRIRASALFYNEDYEPFAIGRDRRVRAALEREEIVVRSCLDHVCLSADELVQRSGKPYEIFTPFRRKWLDVYRAAPCAPVHSARALDGKLLASTKMPKTLAVPPPEAFGYVSNAGFGTGSESGAAKILDRFCREDLTHYAQRRDLPVLDGTSHLSAHLRAGTIGIRTCFNRAFRMLEERDGVDRASVELWISQLIWREFFQAVLKHFPQVAKGPFHEWAAAIPWRKARSDFNAWCAGETGFPIVDAAMRQLNSTGWMHNRLRMIVASFLSKDLLIDWRKGERYFEQHLADADLAQNNGGWQWSASTGCDSVPYFRVFNPITQSMKFDPGGVFIRKMIPELTRVPDAYIHMPWNMPPLLQQEVKCAIGREYPRPIVDHAQARARALAVYKKRRAGG